MNPTIGTLMMEMADGWGYLPLALGLALMMLVVVIRLRKKKQGLGTSLSPHEQIQQMEQKKAVGDDLGQLMVEIQRMTQRVSEQVEQMDAKLLRMEQLIQQADQRIARLEQLSGQEAGNLLMPGTDAAGNVPAKGRAGKDQTEDPLSRSIYALADQGISSDQIARRLNEHVGKVELILALRSA